MDRIASLLVYASALQQRVYRKLSWETRFAQMFVAMRDSGLAEWGKTMGWLMHQAKIEGLPDPGPRFEAKPSLAALPDRYLYAFAKEVYGVAQGILHKEDESDEVMSDLMFAYFSKNPLKPGMSFSAAQSFIKQKVMFLAKDKIRARRNDESMDDDGGGDDDRSKREFADLTRKFNPYGNNADDEVKEISQAFPPLVWEKTVLPSLRQIHPDMPLFFELLGDGESAKDVIEQGKLPNFDPNEYKTPLQTWNAKVQKAKTLIRELREKHGH